MSRILIPFHIADAAFGQGPLKAMIKPLGGPSYHNKLHSYHSLLLRVLASSLLEFSLFEV